MRSNVPAMSVRLTSTSPISAAWKASIARASLVLYVVNHIRPRRTASGPPRAPVRTTEAPSKGTPKSAALSPLRAPSHSSQPPARRSSASPFMVLITVPGATKPRASTLAAVDLFIRFLPLWPGFEPTSRGESLATVLQMALSTSPGLLDFFNCFLRHWLCCSSANADMLIFRFMRRVEAEGLRRAPHRRPSAHSSGAGAGPLTLIAATHGLDEFHS